MLYGLAPLLMIIVTFKGQSTVLRVGTDYSHAA